MKMEITIAVDGDGHGLEFVEMRCGIAIPKSVICDDGDSFRKQVAQGCEINGSGGGVIVHAFTMDGLSCYARNMKCTSRKSVTNRLFERQNEATNFFKNIQESLVHRVEVVIHISRIFLKKHLRLMLFFVWLPTLCFSPTRFPTCI
jgi:hypothetical protein